MAFFKKQQAATSSSLTAVEVWAVRDTPNMNVVGEASYGKQIRPLLPARLGEAGAETSEVVTLHHDASNRHDSNAIEVRARTGTVGYLARQDAALYAPSLSRVQESGRVVSTRARVWGADRNGFIGSVRIVLPPPHLLLPVNNLPEGHRLLPLGKSMQVADEDLYTTALSAYVCSEGECWVHATVHPSGDSTKRYAEVRIDNNVVGRLTPKMSSDLLPAVDFLKDQGQVCAVRALVKGNQLKSEVTLYTQRAHELDQAWLGLSLIHI